MSIEKAAKRERERERERERDYGEQACWIVNTIPIFHCAMRYLWIIF